MESNKFPFQHALQLALIRGADGFSGGRSARILVAADFELGGARLAHALHRELQ